uniref:Peptidase C19 ubiquitin carboxyl-terminal hydrolase domain-containing protein n=1 Tax=Meloidogyne enterolobii TaxID=390850 RepID=A0A6V7X9Y9_MELEN|nr:unnamed protein product [Meloidogyne enterolobii]
MAFLATIFVDDFNGFLPQHAFKFQGMLLDKLAEDSNENNYPENVYNVSLEALTTAATDYFARKRRNMCSSVNDIFRVVYVIIVACPCPMEKIVFDDQIDVDLNVSTDDNDTDLKSYLDSYFQIMQTDECQRCGNKNAPALTYIWRLPDVLIIHLGRVKP